ncbi:MAG: hypothetical protein HN778_06510 [Prolixibacteraceae bacterium]|jgi:hypothetical protein|nr:hypothetical protein [Prolixibacteraceae bacterium]MBT6763409.1 hypothetical protein [Prolixibacteraceae bacterium]MBT6999033.1 hypothetical protein [Prolixibacteraceae bacterium]MBT7394468.1 hypothetical protein [Prolixibacteraceae bacterium]
MKNKGIIIFLIILAVIIVAVMVGDFLSSRPEKSGANPFKYDVDQFKNVDEELILYKETKNFKIGFESPAGISISNNLIYLAGDSKVSVIDFSGKLVKEFNLEGTPNSIKVGNGKIFIAYETFLTIYDLEGNLLNKIDDFNENSFLKSIAVKGTEIFIADAGQRLIYRLSEEGVVLGNFDGKSSDEDFGFIVPSPYFDLAFNAEGDLWVVNPGMHSFENYTGEGDLRTFWKNTSMETPGFSGCCNPAHFTFLPDGSFVTSEKGMVRIKIYKPSGEFFGVVAAPNKFVAEGHAPEVAVDDLGNVYALDFDKKLLRVFELK